MYFVSHAYRPFRRKTAQIRQKSKLARSLQLIGHGRNDRHHILQGVKIMTVTKFQNVAVSLVAALVVASLFVGAAVAPVVSLA
jgi:hypothetical protein